MARSSGTGGSCRRSGELYAKSGRTKLKQATPESGERKDADANALDWVRKTWPEVYSIVTPYYTASRLVSDHTKTEIKRILGVVQQFISEWVYNRFFFVDKLLVPFYPTIKRPSS